LPNWQPFFLSSKIGIIQIHTDKIRFGGTPMFAMDDYLERIWDGILSEEEALIQKTYQELSDIDKQTVLTHLNKMATEEGWLPVQKKSAETALKVISGM
jgi:hypothetical protein